jgi:hypothetical protein
MVTGSTENNGIFRVTVECLLSAHIEKSHFKGIFGCIFRQSLMKYGGNKSMKENSLRSWVLIQAFLPFQFVDVIVITDHDLFWNVGQANCILKYFENMMIDHSDSTILINSFSIFSVNIISLPQEVRCIFVIKAAVEMQNNLPFCD